MKSGLQSLVYVVRPLLEECVIILGVKSSAVPIVKREEGQEHSSLPQSSILLNNELAEVLHAALRVPLYLPILLCSNIACFTHAKRPHWS